MSLLRLAVAISPMPSIPVTEDSLSANAPRPSNPLPVLGASVSMSTLSSGNASSSLRTLTSDRERILGEMEKKQPSSANGLA